ncbi:MAG TPA: hypothetical protein VL442_13550 [Mucilaginibacter sp.]|jgi:hypothetical protein|nr:hypothetical protein [Mucilaginibacter sp.]
MKKHILRIHLLCFLIAFFISRSFGQTVSADSVNLQQTISHFYKAIGEESRLYNGHEYPPYDPQIKNSALYPYDAKTWAPGDINYDDVLYRNVPMMYDVYKDAVIVLLYNKFSMYSLLSDRVHNFSFLNRRFIRLNADQIRDNQLGLSTGFYEQLYAGKKIEVLAKRSKTIQTTSNTTAAPETYFYEKNEYYLKKGDAYYKVSSKGSVLKILKDKKSELQKYIKQNDINYGDNPEDAMAKIASYYDHLTN